MYSLYINAGIIIFFISSLYTSFSNFQFGINPIIDLDRMKVIFKDGSSIKCYEVQDSNDFIRITRDGCINNQEFIINDLYVNKSDVESIIVEKRYLYPSLSEIFNKGK